MSASRRAYPRAFTLIELLVSIAVIGVLISLMAPGLSGARNAARAVVCINQMRTLGQFSSAYADENKESMLRSQHSAFAARSMPWGYALFEYYTGGRFEPGEEFGVAWIELFNGAYRCPLDRREERWSYGYNVYFELTSAETLGRTWTKRSHMPRPSATVLFGELLPTTSADHAMAHFWTQYNAPPEIDPKRHGTTTGAVFLDGHATSVPFATLFDRSTDIDSFNPQTAY